MSDTVQNYINDLLARGYEYPQVESFTRLAFGVTQEEFIKFYDLTN